jgi:AcrR family transcriptional regulator
MSRWKPNARERLEQAALGLYRERGFDQTTVAEIAAHAGLTERTFFRYFADKREVLFWGQGALAEAFQSSIAAAPASAAPMDAVAEALAVAAAQIEDRRELTRQRRAVVAANLGLQERELLKRAALATTIAEALRRRGVPDPAARLAAEAGMAVFAIAFTRWLEGSDHDTLAQLMRTSLAELRAVIAATSD